MRNEDQNEQGVGHYIALGGGLGAGIGAALGISLGKVELGVAIGPAIGIALAVAFWSIKAHDASSSDDG